MIDERALVDTGAQIGSGVTIGPFTIIESGVAIGPDTWIGPNVVIRRNTTIGAENKIYQFSSVGEDPQYADYQNEETYLVIGDRNVRAGAIGSSESSIAMESVAGWPVRDTCAQQTGDIHRGSHWIRNGYLLCRFGGSEPDQSSPRDKSDCGNP